MPRVLRVALISIAILMLTGGSLSAGAGPDATASGEVQNETAIFAGGLFWAMKPPFENLPGVIEVINGYSGGNKDNPTFQEVATGGTGHVQAVKIIYNPAKVTYSELLDVFWRNIDPTDGGGQFSERGDQYRTVIFYLDEGQKTLAEGSKAEMEKSGRFDKPIVTEIAAAATFYKAEESQQNYNKIPSRRYKFYIEKSITLRDQYLEKVWGKK